MRLRNWSGRWPGNGATISPAFDFIGHKASTTPSVIFRYMAKKYSDLGTQRAWHLPSTTVSTITVAQLPG